uniref:Uncharacterized protein n=1 Tax=Aegilops tauschii subsp. strangulata TaxID=200361 RepID=A0A453HZ95_AEGTS
MIVNQILSEKQGRKLDEKGKRYSSVEGCRSYEDIRTVDGVVHPTYKSACYALGLLNDDKEWNDCIKEASHLAFAPQMHQLFCTILLFCEVTDPMEEL